MRAKILLDSLRGAKELKVTILQKAKFREIKKAGSGEAETQADRLK